MKFESEIAVLAIIIGGGIAAAVVVLGLMLLKKGVQLSGWLQLVALALSLTGVAGAIFAGAGYMSEVQTGYFFSGTTAVIAVVALAIIGYQAIATDAQHYEPIE